ncbi:hypothetical protein Y032_0426g1258 [Ancylostoma ceylanicum]|uniref:Uncharacterized protein n=1 Tax=Ancylostoma ceylanicum TaxID=53326 RepID=A0A016X0W0_9BILA|nr:hypothetical protein Y032_0426g1258 [Ancylostoma ceylanicum]
MPAAAKWSSETSELVNIMMARWLKFFAGYAAMREFKRQQMNDDKNRNEDSNTWDGTFYRASNTNLLTPMAEDSE